MVASCNKGMAFGIGPKGAWFSALALLVIFLFFSSEKNRLTKTGLALILGGGLANLLDRILAGCVRDFIQVGFLPIFNLADTAICVGASLVILSMLAKNFSLKLKK